MYKKLANAVFWFHLVIFALLVWGPFLSIMWDIYKPINNILVTVTITSQIMWGGCPLVALENALRKKDDPSHTIFGSFLCYYAKKKFGIQIPPSAITLSLVLITIAAVYINIT